MSRARRICQARDRGVCKFCGRRRPWEAHHETPKADGGRTVAENLATACVRCHRNLTRKQAAARAAASRLAEYLRKRTITAAFWAEIDLDRTAATVPR